MSEVSRTEWLVDAADSRLTPERLTWVADPRRPDRLAWNAFRTLALWNTDAWVPPLVERACGPAGPLSGLDWADGSVSHWVADPDAVGADVCDVVVEGPEGYLVVAATLAGSPPAKGLRAAAIAALDGSLGEGGRSAGLVVVGPPGTGAEIEAVLDEAGRFEVHGGENLADLLAGATGTVPWTDLGRLALDLAEEGADEPIEQVRRLVAELQAQYPDEDL